MKGDERRIAMEKQHLILASGFQFGVFNIGSIGFIHIFAAILLIPIIRIFIGIFGFLGYIIIGTGFLLYIKRLYDGLDKDDTPKYYQDEELPWITIAD